MRTSSYNIYVRLQEEDAFLIIQGYTGAMDRINEQVYKYLKGENYNTELVTPSTIKQLSNRGYLTERSQQEERLHLKRIAEAYHHRHLKEAAFLFMPTFSCQLRCLYCYEAPISHKEDDTSQAVMSSEHIQSAYNAIDKICESLQKKSPTEITLYGGEPLIAKNYDIVKEIVEEGIKRSFRIRAITNGYDLVKYKDLLGKDKIDYLQITLDGVEDIHNCRRFTKDKLPTFKEICAGVQLALDVGCTVALRTNVDRSNLAGLKELNNFYIEQGWNKNSKFYPYAYVTHDWLRGKVMMPMELLKAVEEMFCDCRDQRLLNFDFGIDQCFMILLRGGEIPSLKPYYCGSSIGSYIFGPDGYIYTCWDEVGLEEGIIGSYMPDLYWNKERSNLWLRRSIANMPQCLECPYALLCGGGCGRQAKKATGSIMNGFCHQFQELFQYFAPALTQSYMEWLAKGDGKKGESKSELAACS